jgi:HD-GYP domain-containing protein (c-di-GMP phosphodiesterase class II)
MKKSKKKLQHIIQLGVEVSQIGDLDILLEKILSEARNLVDADAGSIYIKEGEELKFSYAQNETLRKKLGPGKKLIYTTFSMPITKKSIAGFVASEGKVLNLPDAYKISKKMPYSHNSSYDKLAGYETHSMLTVPLKNNRGDIIGVLQLINAQEKNGKIIPFSDDDESYIKPFAMYAAVAIERAQLTRTTIMRMISMAELRDPKETGAHVNRVAAYALEIYEHWAHTKGIAKEETDKQRDAFRMAAMLHDVGKVAISDTILKKPGKFTDEEYEIMKMHAWAGACLFSGARSDFDSIAAEVALTHHERWDGKGYPGWIDEKTGDVYPKCIDKKSGKARGKKEEEIPIWGRIVALADVFDALSSNRVYKEAWTEEDVLQKIKDDKGKHFDPEIVDSFFEVYDQIKAVSQRYPDQ